jgi:hypothetical protein
MAYIGQEPGLGEAERFIFTALGSETSITADDDGVLINYVVNQLSLYLNGVKLVMGTDFTATNGSTITGLVALAAGDVVEVIALSTFSPADTVPATGGTFSGGITGTTIDATTDFTIGGTVITDNTITDDGTLTITATTGITLGQDTALSAGKDLETSTTGKIKQKGAFMQSSTHQAMVLGG